MKTRNELSAREIVQVQESLARRLGDTSVPTLPQVAVKIIELVSNPDATIAAFAETIRTDQALTGRLLRMANSAYFAQRQPVTKVERAMVLLGLDRLKAIALGFHLTKIASADDDEFGFKRLWTQSLFRGWAALRLAERLNKAVSGEAFIVGLMSDAGISMMPKLVGDTYREIASPSQPPAKHFLAESTNFEFTHVDVAAVLAQMWKLPELLTRPITMHHTAPGAPPSPSDDDSVIHAVSYFVGLIPLDPRGGVQESGQVASVGRRLFNLEPADICELFKTAAKDFDACRAIFSHIIDEDLSVDRILDQANKQLGEDESDAPADAGPVTRLEAGGLVFEIGAPDAEGAVSVVIADQQGVRLVTERIDPTRQSVDEIRRILMLDAAEPGEAGRVLEGITTLAA